MNNSGCKANEKYWIGWYHCIGKSVTKPQGLWYPALLSCWCPLTLSIGLNHNNSLTTYVPLKKGKCGLCTTNTESENRGNHFSVSWIFPSAYNQRAVQRRKTMKKSVWNLGCETRTHDLSPTILPTELMVHDLADYFYKNDYFLQDLKLCSNIPLPQ